MNSVLANCSVSISELKRNPSALIDQAEGAPIAILNHNKPTAYLIPAETYEELMEKVEDYHLGVIVKKRQNEKNSGIHIDIDDL
ncbi:MAG: antitoxin [Spirochaetes bacterium]|nr:MAG: antitoxin [Spirochaetota bacterium]